MVLLQEDPCFEEANMSIYKRQSDFWIGIDSDGCAMNTMKVKHQHCFGPALVKVWNLEDHQDEVLKIWDEINLYSETRGLNRFRALVPALKKIHQNIQPLEDIRPLEEWIQKESTFTNATLGFQIHIADAPVLRKALSWSERANACIERIPFDQKTPFKGVEAALMAVQGKADIAIVSRANRKALVEEWKIHGLLPYVNHILAQDSGTKEAAIEIMKDQGYAKEAMLLLGNTPSDLKVVDHTGIAFFPIQVGKEEESWALFTETILPAFLNGKYAEMEADYIASFKSDLGIR